MTTGIRILPAAARPAPELLAALAAQAASNLSDVMARANTASSALRPRHRGDKLCGPALTVRVPQGDNLMIHKAIDLAQRGEVIVVDGGGFTEVALVGDIMTAYAASRGVAGFVIDGAIRDVDDIAARPLPVYSRGVTARGPTREHPGEINVPVSVGGISVQPGDLIVGDADGLVAVPTAALAQVLEAVAALREKERKLLADIAAGTVDRAWVDAALRAKGCAT
jgi:RraA family protein